MKQSLSLLFSLGLGTIGQSLLATSATSQVTSDNTTNTQVIENNNVSTIEGGVVNGENLFHSFQEFSVVVGSEAFFNNSINIDNILSRVTGGNISNINGTIRANGDANLFLINPAGIMFGENARLDIGGSFYGSTADRILFPEGEFSAIATDSQPTLIVNAPIGLGFRDNPASISAIGDNNPIQLAVPKGNSFNLIGGEINLTQGIIFAEEGSINLAAISQAGTVEFNEDNSFNFEDAIALNNINLDDFELFVFSSPSGSDSGNISLVGSSLNLNNESRLINITQGRGNAGNANIKTTDSVIINNNSDILTDTFAEGNAGNITIDAGNNLIIEGINGINIVQRNEISASASFDPELLGELTGNAGNIDITANNISLTNNAQVVNNTFGSGNAGNITFSAESVTVENNSSFFSAVGNQQNNAEAIGNGGTINIATNTLSLIDGGVIIVQTFGAGNAGNININATDIEILGIAEFPSEGSILLEDGENPAGFSSGLFSNTEPSALGLGGEINVTTNTLKIDDGAVINARSRGSSAAGNVFVNADVLEITNGSQILTTAFNNGAAGNIDLNISERILISGIDRDFETRVARLEESGADVEFVIDPVSADSGIFANTTASATEGVTGDINIEVGERLELRDGSLISTQASNVADGGNINITTENGFVIGFPSDTLGGDIVANAPEAEGGNIIITAQAVLGFEENVAFNNMGDRANNNSNDLDATGNIDGVVTIITPDVDVIQGMPQLSTNPIEGEQNISRACGGRNRTANDSSFVLTGKGGIPASPGELFDSQNIVINGRATPISTTPQPIETSKGKIQPARGVQVTESGEIMLTAYRTNNLGDMPRQEFISCPT